MQDEEVCRYLAWTPPRAIDETLELIRQAEGLMARRESIVFAQVWRETGRAIGSTRLLDVRPADRQVEIGSTFLAREYWRTPANTESKQRDTVYFSILDTEWPSVRSRLAARLYA